MVVTLLAAPPCEQSRPAFPPPPNMPPPVETTPLVPLACICSSPFYVDARKRSMRERPEASARGDVRLISRHKSSGGPAVAPASAAHLKGAVQSPIDSHFSLRPLVDATNDAVVELRPDGIVVQMLSSTAFGYTPVQILGRSFLSICHTDDHPDILQTMQALLLPLWQRSRSVVILPQGQFSGADDIPKTVRVLHRVIVGLNGPRVPETVAVDTILSVIESSSETLLLSSRRALPRLSQLVGADAISPPEAPRLAIFPWTAHTPQKAKQQAQGNATCNGNDGHGMPTQRSTATLWWRADRRAAR